MIIFGIDPGSAITGYGVIQTQNNQVNWVDSGIISTKKCNNLPEKLECIYNGLQDKLQLHKPDLVCVEEAFYGKNVRTTLVLGHARGVALLAGKVSNALIVEYSPREIKKSLVGNGNASKDQVVYMIHTLLKPPKKNAQVDACDALAAAMCGFVHYGRSFK